jgi:hypothetical protein
VPLVISKSKIYLTVVWSLAATIIGGMGILNVSTFAQFDDIQDENADITINAQVTKDRANMFDKSTVYHDVKNFKVSLSNDSNLCPTNDCTFKFIHEDDFEGFTTNGISDRSLDGVLKVTSQGKTKLYDVNGDLNLIEEENAPDGSVTKELLEGTLRFSQGDDYFGGDEYAVNGTLTWNSENKGDLSLEGFL